MKAYLANDGTVLIVLSEIEQLESTADWTLVESDSSMTPKRSSNYAMLGSIDFEHSIFRPFAAPRLNDFTQIRFWRHLRARFKVQPDVIARFDDDSPAIWQTLRKEGEGQVVVFATGWQPSHSQLALSSKFLPIINRVIEFSATAPQVVDSMVIGQPLKLPAAYLNATVRCESRSFRRDPDRSVSDQFDRPGVYHFTVNDGPSDMEDVSIAVNLDPAESQTEPMPLEQLTAYGVQVGKHLDAASEVEQKRQLRDKELEDKQRLWKWLIVGAIALILGETWLAGRTDRANRAQDIIES